MSYYNNWNRVSRISLSGHRLMDERILSGEVNVDQLSFSDMIRNADLILSGWENNILPSPQTNNVNSQNGIRFNNASSPDNLEDHSDFFLIRPVCDSNRYNTGNRFADNKSTG